MLRDPSVPVLEQFLLGAALVMGIQYLIALQKYVMLMIGMAMTSQAGSESKGLRQAVEDLIMSNG